GARKKMSGVLHCSAELIVGGFEKRRECGAHGSAGAGRRVFFFEKMAELSRERIVVLTRRQRDGEKALRGFHWRKRGPCVELFPREREGADVARGFECHAFVAVELVFNERIEHGVYGRATRGERGGVDPTPAANPAAN